MTLGWWRNWGSTDKPRTINLSRRESERLLKINIEFYEDFFKEVIILPVLYWKCQRSVIQRILERRIKRVFLWWQWYSTCKKKIIRWWFCAHFSLINQSLVMSMPCQSCQRNAFLIYGGELSLLRAKKEPWRPRNVTLCLKVAISRQIIFETRNDFRSTVNVVLDRNTIKMETFWAHFQTMCVIRCRNDIILYRWYGTNLNSRRSIFFFRERRGANPLNFPSKGMIFNHGFIVVERAKRAKPLSTLGQITPLVLSQIPLLRRY